MQLRLRPRVVPGYRLAVCLVVCLAPSLVAESPARFRRPQSLVLVEHNRQLVVANRGGSICLIDTDKGKVLREQIVGEKLSCIVAIPATRSEWLLATDESKHRILLLRRRPDRIETVQQLPISSYPVRVAVSADGRRAFVSSLWSRRLTVLKIAPAPAPKLSIQKTLDLPFAPREMLLVRKDQKLIVADSFGGRLGVFDAGKMKWVGVRSFPGHNIRGLGVSTNGKMLVVAHQMLNELAHTVRNDVHWGLLMSNDLRWLRLQGVLDGKDLYEGAHMHPLGEAGSATGDPSSLVVAADGTVVVSLGGVGEIALGKESDFSLLRVKVGKRPTGLIVNRTGSKAYVTNTFGESISIVDLRKRQLVKSISLGPRPKPSLAERGEVLFFDARLSHDGWMSCHSCHTDGHTNGLLNDNFSDASFGAPKRVLSLLGKGRTAPFAWDASAANLDKQIRNSIVKTMQSDEPPAAGQINALKAYLNTLQPPPPIDKARGTFDAPAAARGRTLFGRLQCGNCHTPPVYTSVGTYDVGLKDKLGKKKFNPPSLLGVGQRGPYFHDNRAIELKDVFTKHRHQLRKDLTPKQLNDLLAFLRSL